MEQAADTLVAVTPKFVDILPNSRKPVLSGVSDRPEPVDDPNKSAAAATAAPDIPATTDVAAVKDAEPKDDGKKDETPAWMKAQISKEKNRRKALEDDNTALREQNRQILALLERVAPKQEAKEPQEEDFATPKEYAKAYGEWYAHKTISERDTQAKQKTEQTEAQKRLDVHKQRLEKAQDKYPDIIDLANDSTLPISQAMGILIMESEAGPDLLNWLGEHREEAAKIAAMSPALATAELGKVEVKMKEKPATQVSKAPKPISPVGSNNGVQKDKNDPNLSSADYWAIVDAERAEKVARLRAGK